MATQHIQAERRDGVLKLTLDRPDVLNSFNARMADELAAALQAAPATPRSAPCCSRESVAPSAPARTSPK